MQVVLGIGGLAGYLAKSSLPSLFGGVGSALVVGACSHLSYQAYKSGTTFRMGTVISLGMSVLLAVVMGQRYQHTHKLMPAGLVAGLSVHVARRLPASFFMLWWCMGAAMAAFYVWNLLFFSPTFKKE